MPEAKHFITFRGKTQSLNAWAKEIGMTYHSLKMRLDYGWGIEEALTVKKQIHVKKPKVTEEKKPQRVIVLKSAAE